MFGEDKFFEREVINFKPNFSIMIDVKFPLSNVQMKLMKIVQHQLFDKELAELKDMLAKFYADKAINKANEIWDNKGLSNAEMEKWVNEKS
jgi:hypothetical protein